MSYTVLARKYRSRTFDEVVGQNHVAQTLKKAIETDRIAHAYLFTGTRGTGKTSMARILAKALNCERSSKPTATPCLECNSCVAIARGDDMDVIEIDAASNTQVDKTREVILDHAQYRPARSRFKIYIIDEVHMLSKASFNALLKTLEEPPEHVKFILATTEAEKILPTIISRCQRYDFRNIPTREIAGHLKEILKKEKIKADEEAVMLIAKAGAGSMRDALSLLDRLLSVGEKQLSVETIEQYLGLPRSQAIFDLAQRIGEGKVAEVLKLADKLICEGLSPDTLANALSDHLRNLLVVRTCGNDSELVEVAGLSAADLEKQAGRFDPVVLTQDITILEDLRRQLRQTQAGRALLDATLVRLALAEQFTSIGELLGQVESSSTSVSSGQKKKFEQIEVKAEPEVRQAAPYEAPVVTAVADDNDDDLPAPGKVWEAGGPSLVEMMKAGPVVVEAKPVAEKSNVEAVDEKDLRAVWGKLMEVLKSENRPSLASIVEQGELVAVDEYQATLRYSADRQTFFNLMGRNGKKELVGEVISRVIGRAVGVKLELDAKAAAKAEPVAKPVTSLASAKADPTADGAPSVVQRMPEARLTPEQIAEAQKRPLVAALMKKLDASIVRISEE
jgi:DNA polymerase III subunit gamma/tau